MRPMRASGFPWWWLWIPRRARQAILRLQRPVNVLDYGADPTGQRDSTPAIQAALRAAEGRGNWWPAWLWQPRFVRRIITLQRTAYLPPGQYGARGVEMPSGTTLIGKPPPRDEAQ